MSQAKRLLAAFAGSDVAHGTTQVGRITRNGKADAKSRIIREPLTLDLVQGHIDGTLGVGAIPINEHNKCQFGALDIDEYDLDHKALHEKIVKLKLPLLHCRSKSGGAHLYLFLKEFEQAAVVREYLTEMSILLGHSGCEIFPKQDTILFERGDVGNFINMPYFNAELPHRYCYNDAVEAMELDEFLDAVDASRVSLSDLESVRTSRKVRKYFDDGPPCLQHLFAEGPLSEPRNKLLFHIGVYCKSKFPDNWQSSMEEYNRTLFSPPLGSQEVLGVIKQHEKKDYGYTCGDEPFRSYCDPVMCAAAPHGITSRTEGTPQLGGLTIQLSEPRIYFMDVDGKRLVLTVDQLHSPSQWQKACMEQCQFMPPVPKGHQWQQMINNLMQNATLLEVPEEGTTRGEFNDLLRAYCTSRIRALEPEEIEMGRPWTDDGVTKFTLGGLTEFLHNRRFTKVNRAQVILFLRELGGNDSKIWIKRPDGQRKQVRIWWVPAFDNFEPELKVEETQDDIPF
jgi:hypothetical protein